MTATEHNDDDGEKDTGTAVRKTFPGPMRGIRYEADGGFSGAELQSGWVTSHVDDEADAIVAAEVRDRKGETGQVESVGFSVELEDGDGELEAYAELEPDAAAELAREILSEVER